MKRLKASVPIASLLIGLPNQKPFTAAYNY